jgi:hypothetical protein
MAAADPFDSASSMREGNRRLLERLDGFGDDDLPAGFLDEVELFQRRAAATGVYLSALDDRSEAQSLINFWLTVRFTGGARPETIILEDFDTQAARARAGGAAPYKGLDSFQVEDVASFFGRTSAVRVMLDRLGAHRMLAVTGLSGSGKSSVVRAGLIPRLREGELPGSREWRVPDPIVPGKDPVRALADLAARLAPSSGPLRDPADLVAALDSTGVPVLLSIDQFEELFTLCEREEDRLFVLQALTAVAATGKHRHVVVVTMRSEFDSRVETDPAFAALFAAGRIQIGALSARELRTAIEQPAAQVGVQFEPGLPDELVQRVLGEPAGLPLLQFTLLQLWKHPTPHNKLGWEAYTSLGGSPREILARRATQVFESFETNQDRTFSHRIFLALAEIGAGLEATSRRVVRSELDRIGSRDSVDHVLGVWRENGLIRISPPGPIGPTSQVEVAHEALIRNWDLLVGWIEDHFAETRRRRVLTEQALAWKEGGHDTLLGELSLKEAEGLADLDPVESDYVAASRAEIDRQYRAIRRRNWAGAAVAAASLLLLAGAVWAAAFAWDERDRANDATRQSMIQAADFEQRSRALQRQTSQQLMVAEKATSEARIALARAKAEEAAVRSARDRLKAQLDQALRKRDSMLAQQRQIGAATASAAYKLKDLRAQIEDLQKSKLAAELALDQKAEEVEQLNGTVDQLTSQALTTASERPAILLEPDGRLEVALGESGIPVSWQKSLVGHRSAIEAAARSVGRLQGGGTAPGSHGTAFMVGNGIAMALRFELPRSGDVRGMTIDFSTRPQGDGGREFAVESVIAEFAVPSREQAIVLLRVARRNRLGQSLPPPLPVAELTRALAADRFAEAGSPAMLEPYKGMELYLVGYPVPDLRMPVEINQAVLGDVAAAKRIQPGALLDYTMSGRTGVLKYDSTTFGGNGGSPVIDLDTGLVIGIHLGGEFGKGKMGIAFFASVVRAPEWQRAGLRIAAVPRRPRRP